MKVVGITSSFHAGSNSQILVEEILSGAREAGAEVELVRLAELQINACIGCEHCKKEGNSTCFQKDGIGKIYDELAKADIVVFGLPVYFGRANAPFLMMIDRLYAMIGTGISTRLPAGKKFAVAITSGGGGLEVISTIYDSIAEIFGTYFGWETKGLIWQNGMHEKKEIDKHPDKLKEAKELGRNLLK